MYESIIDIRDYLFPVVIVNHNDVLYIEDRRPTWAMLIAGLAALGLLVFTVYLLVTSDSYSLRLITDNIWLYVILTGLLAASVIFALRGSFREIYVFDRPRDSFTFTRQSVLSKEVIEGGLSQFRGVRVERHEIDDDTYEYLVALVQDGPFLSGADTHILREDLPVFSSQASESRIADAIAKFLKMEHVDEVIDDDDDDDELTLLKLSE